MQTFEGTVTSAKTPQTIAVSIHYSVKHRKYGKIIKRTTKLLAHNQTEGVKVGDLVEISQSRPYSKTKHFLVTKVINKSPTKTEEPVKEVAKTKVKKNKKSK